MKPRSTTRTENATTTTRTMGNATTTRSETTIGMDLGDKFHVLRVLDGAGNVIGEGRISWTYGALEGTFARRAPTMVALGAGTHSPWVSRALAGWGHTVLVGNPRKVGAIRHDPARNA